MIDSRYSLKSLHQLLSICIKAHIQPNYWKGNVKCLIFRKNSSVLLRSKSWENQSKYLIHHKRSPITGEECEDEDDHWTLPNRKLKERIRIFASVNNISLDCIHDNQTQFII
eukprot:957250_1